MSQADEPRSNSGEAAAAARVRELELSLSLLQADLEAARERVTAADDSIRRFQQVAKASEQARAELQVSDWRGVFCYVGQVR